MLGWSGAANTVIFRKMPVNVFPALAQDGYVETSPEDVHYNCIAWAAGLADEWWDPTDSSYFWPEDVRRESTISAFVAVFEKLGYSLADDVDLEPGIEKLAIFALHGRVTHMARQLPNGHWTSKLGQWIDIEHSLEGLVGEEYGEIAQILRRPI